MRKNIFLTTIIALLSWCVQSQTLLYSDDFESYNLGSYLAAQKPAWWTTWANAPGTPEDAVIKNNFAHSAAKSVFISGATTDLLLKLGDKTTGKYELDWWVYVETDKSGFYSILHAPPPTVEYGMSVYFRQNGTGELFAGSDTPILFTYPKANWFKVKHLIDLDNDNITLFVNGIKVSQWPFSHQARLTTGKKILSQVDFYPGIRTGSGEVPQLYFDDIYFSQLNAIGDPVIGVNPASLSVALGQQTSDTRQITISNTGASNMEYDVNFFYGASVKQSISLTSSLVTAASPSQPASAAKATPASPYQTNATAVLRYDRADSTAIGWKKPPVTVTVAARFPNAMTLPYANMFLESVDVKISQLNATASNTMTLLIYGMGSVSEPGTSLVSQTFAPVAASWNKIVLTKPLRVTGEDLWVGYRFTEADSNIYIPGTDGGPNNPNGDFFNLGEGWQHLSSNSLFPYNWNIRANLNGDAINHWFTVTPTHGTISPGGNAVLTVNFNKTGLISGSYDGIIRIISDDPLHKWTDIPTKLSTTVGINEVDKVAAYIFPNPVENLLNIISEEKILEVAVISYDGKTVLAAHGSSVDVSGLSAGVYLVQLKTAKGSARLSFTKK